MWGSHSGPLLLEKYQKIVEKFGIKNKIVRLVTDSTSNNINAFRNLIIPGFEQYFIDDDDDGSSNDGNDSDGTLSDEYDYPPDISSKTDSLTAIDLSFEDLIQESMSRGDFNNIRPSGKPLHERNPHYMDFTTYKINEILIDNGKIKLQEKKIEMICSKLS